MSLDEQRILCVDCVVMTMKPADKSLYLIGSIRQQFFQTIDYEIWKKKIMAMFLEERNRYGFVCVVQRTSPRRTVQVLQIERINS
jgi:hypothetical protein